MTAQKLANGPPNDGSEHSQSSTPVSNVHRSRNQLARIRTNLAESRTLMAADRSLMAWVRTALALVSFGFTIYKFLGSAPDLSRGHNGQYIGMFLTGLSVLSMGFGLAEYWGTIKELRRNNEVTVWRATFIMALVMTVTGLFFFVSIVTRLL